MIVARVAARSMPRLLTTRAGARGQLTVFVGLLVLLGAVVVAPLAEVLGVAEVGALLARPVLRAALVNTVVAGVAAVVLGSVVALPLALLVARYEFPGRAAVQTLAVLPLLVPPYLGAVAFEQVLGRSGVVNVFLLETFGFGLRVMDGLAGVVLVQGLHYFPFILINTAAALHAIDPAAEEAAQMLGCRGWRLLRRITLPLALPGFVAGALLVFIRVIDDLGTPLMLGYTALLAPQAYLDVTRAGIDDGGGAMACVLLVAMSALALWTATAFPGRVDWAVEPDRPARVVERLHGRGRLVAWAIAAGLLVLTLLPHAGIVLLSFSTLWSFSYLPAGWTLDHYRAIVGAPHLVWNTIRYAVLAAALDVVVGGAIAWLLVRGSVRGRAVLAVIATIPLAVPGVVLAIGYLLVFRDRMVSGLGAALTASGLVLVLAYAVRRLPYTVRSSSVHLGSLHASMEESAQSLGARPGRAVRRITLPLVMRGLAMAGVLAFATSAVELSSTLLLVARPELAPLSYGIYTAMQSPLGRGPGAALGVVAIALVALATVLVTRLGGREAAAFRL